MNTNLTLANLIGTPKQIKWAESIREKMLAENYWYAKKIARITSAAWFIRMRDRDLMGCQIVRQLAAERKRSESEEKLPEDYEENEHYYTKLAIYNSLMRNH